MPVADKYRILFDHTADAIFIYSAMAGIFLEVNHVACERLGYSREEFLSMSPIDISAVWWSEKTGKNIRQCLALGGTLFETCHLSKSGEIIPVELSVRAIDYFGQPAGLVIARDISQRLLAEKALKEKEERHRSILQTAMDGFWIVDSQGRILEVNETYCRMSGYSMPELLGMHIFDLEIIETQAEVKMHIQKIIALGEERFESKHRRKDGSVYEVESSVQYRPNNGRLIAFLRDISRQKQTEKALQESNQLFALFIHHSPIYSYIKEVSATQSKVLHASENFKEMVNIPGSEMVGKSMEQLFPVAMAAKMTADDLAVVSRGEVLRLDEDLNGRSYTSIKFPIRQGKKILLSGHTMDVTERKQTERALQASEEKFRSYMEEAPDGIFVTDAAGFYQEVNPAVCKLLGYTREELLRTHAIKIVAESHVEKANRFFEILQKEGSYAGEIKFVRKDGSRFEGLLNAVKINLNQCLGFVKDITKLNQLQQALTEKQEQEYAGVAQELHDNLGQELTGIMMLCKALEQKLYIRQQPEAVEAGKLHQLLKNSFDGVRGLIRTLFPAQLAKVGLDACLLQLAISRFEQNHIQCEVAFGEEGIIPDATIGMQVFYIAKEAVNNAVKHSQASRINIRLEKQDGQAILLILDNGCGFAAPDWERKGMGLLIMQHRADLINAHLAISPGPEQCGTLVTCRIPLANKPAKGSANEK